MLDPKRIRTDIEAVAKNLAKRGYALDTEKLQALETERKVLQQECESLQQERNARSKNIGKAKAAGEDIAPLLKEVDNLKKALGEAESKLGALQSELDAILAGIPNTVADEVPEGASEDDNVEVSTWGEPRKFNFEVKDHVDVGAVSGGLDFETAGKITGSRFAVMKGGIARLHRALIQFMLDTHINDHGYDEIYVPFIVNKDSLFGHGSTAKIRRRFVQVARRSRVLSYSYSGSPRYKRDAWRNY